MLDIMVATYGPQMDTVVSRLPPTAQYKLKEWDPRVRGSAGQAAAEDWVATSEAEQFRRNWRNSPITGFLGISNPFPGPVSNDPPSSAGEVIYLDEPASSPDLLPWVLGGGVGLVLLLLLVR